MTTFEKLVEIINRVNKTSIPADCIKPQNLRPFVSQVEGKQVNTAIDVVGIVDKGYTGTFPFYYNRIEINRLFDGISVAITVPFADVSTALVVAELNKLYPSLNLNHEEFQIGYSVAGTPQFTLVSKSDSLMYLGSLIVGVNYLLSDIKLDLTNTSLAGFSYSV